MQPSQMFNPMEREVYQDKFVNQNDGKVRASAKNNKVIANMMTSSEYKAPKNQQYNQYAEV